MSSYLEAAKIQFEEEGFILLPNISNEEFSPNLKTSKDRLLGKYQYAEVNIPKLAADTIKFFTGRTVTKGKLVEIKHRDYKLLDETKEFFAFLELSDDWEIEDGGNVTVADGEGEHLEIPFVKNSLFLSSVYPLWYISYCNHYAEDKRRVIIIEF